MPVDPAALREALARRDEWLRRPETVPMYSVVIEAAAREFLRLMETAETVDLCEEHGQIGTLTPEPHCWLNGIVENPCRMVEAVLARRDTEPFVNQQGLW